jgi:flavodoxin
MPMKAMVIYASRYGNTERIAHAIGTGLSDTCGTNVDVEVLAVDAAQPDKLGELDLLLVGAPTNGSRPSPPMQNFLNAIPNTLHGVKVAAFDTRTDVDKLEGAAHFFGKIFDRIGYAAPRILSSLEKKGGQAAQPPEGFFVTGTEGPLVDGELERATTWGGQFATLHQGEPAL